LNGVRNPAPTDGYAVPGDRIHVRGKPFRARHHARTGRARSRETASASAIRGAGLRRRVPERVIVVPWPTDRTTEIHEILGRDGFGADDVRRDGAADESVRRTAVRCRPVSTRARSSLVHSASIRRHRGSNPRCPHLGVDGDRFQETTATAARREGPSRTRGGSARAPLSNAPTTGVA
jgi:hypothetical protein